ncbi:MAG: efflux RND transporter periplasmic adaptor subunit [Nitrospirales bacterium]
MLIALRLNRGFRTCLLLGLVGWLGCTEQQAAQPPKGRPPTPVRVVVAEQKEVQRSVSLVGTAKPWKRSVVASEVGGLVESYPVKEGVFVKKGQLLARLRTDTLQIRYDAAVASRAEAKFRHEQAQKDLERIKVLFAKELVTQKEFDDAITQESALGERLTLLDAEIRQAQDRLTKSKILAPFSGWVIKEFTEIGQWVEEGGAVVELVDLSHVEVEVPLPEEFVRHVSTGDGVIAEFDGLPGVEIPGKVYSVVAQADPVARTFPVKVDLGNPDLRIKSGMVARVSLNVGAPYAAVVIPKDALVLKGGKEYVFIVNEGTVTQISVKPLTHFDELVEVNGPVKEGMQVVVSGNERLLPGQPIRILDEAAES